MCLKYVTFSLLPDFVILFLLLQLLPPELALTFLLNKMLHSLHTISICAMLSDI